MCLRWLEMNGKEMFCDFAGKAKRVRIEVPGVSGVSSGSSEEEEMEIGVGEKAESDEMMMARLQASMSPGAMMRGNPWFGGSRIGGRRL